jgi:hypothetical protein
MSIICVTLLSASAAAQFTYDQYFSFSGFIPTVTVDDRPAALQAGLYPSLYTQRSISRDLRWVADNDSALLVFWQEQGDTILHILRELSGLEWQERAMRLHLVRFFPSVGCPDPLIIPVGGMRQGGLIEAAPSGLNMKLNLVYQLAQRMLAQADRPGTRVLPAIAYHPLMKPGPYRRDNLAWLLALSVGQSVLGMDSTEQAFESAFWKGRTPGRQILERYLLGHWILTPQRPLSDWIVGEPYSSSLVEATRPPRRPEGTEGQDHTAFVEGLPVKGILGFSVRTDQANFPVVDKIDVHRLAYASGLWEGDQIRRVDGSLVRTHRALVERILEGIELNGGATLEIRRDDRLQTIIIQSAGYPLEKGNGEGLEIEETSRNSGVETPSPDDSLYDQAPSTSPWEKKPEPLPPRSP